MYGLPLPASPVVVFVPDWLVCGQRSPRTRAGRGGEDGHVEADLGVSGSVPPWEPSA